MFRRFTLYPAARVLLKDGRPIELGARAFDLLATLIGRRGAVIQKRDLMAAAWPHTTVAEDNLRSQMFGLRRALGEDGGAIKNVTGRGYLLAADLIADERQGAVGSPPAHTSCDLLNGSSSGLQEGLEQ